MKTSETTPTKALLGAATASLAALGIVFVASNVSPPAPVVVAPEPYTCRMPIQSLRSPPPPMPAPTMDIDIDIPRALAPTSK
jgi:hypothetical protein